jgi:hypothetical protein
MRPADEETWEQEYWDDYLNEFGPEAYVEARFGTEPLQNMERNREVTGDGAQGQDLAAA